VTKMSAPMHPNFRNDVKKGRLEFKEFVILFVTFLLLCFFTIERFSYAVKRSTRKRAEIQVASIISRQNAYKRTHEHYGTLEEIGFLNPFSDNSVVFILSFDNGFIIQAKENLQFDSFGDGVAGNEYFIGYSSGVIEYNR
jgi:hypothetical protein